MDRDFAREMMANRNLDEARKLNPQLQTFDQFLAKNKQAVVASTEPVPAA